METKQPECPECDKLIAVSDLSQPIGEFLEWLSAERKLVIAQWIVNEFDDEEISCDSILVPAYIPINQLLAEYFDIDMDKAEKERSALLEYLRNNQ